MASFDVPTTNDFLAQLRMQIDRALDRFRRAKLAIDSEVASAGATGSSRQALLLLDAMDEHIEKGVAVLLGELRRATNYPELDAVELRSLIGPRLDELVSGIIAACRFSAATRNLQNPQFQAMVDARTAKARSNVQFWLRQFDIGWDEPVDPEPLKRPPNRR